MVVCWGCAVTEKEDLQIIFDIKGKLGVVSQAFLRVSKFSFNPLTTRSDHYINSSNNFNTLSSKQVMRIKRIIN